MMDFIMMTISFTVAILLASGLGFLIMTNQKVMKWYMNYFAKTMNKFDNALDELEAKDL